jgi:hypothetical protein
MTYCSLRIPLKTISKVRAMPKDGLPFPGTMHTHNHKHTHTYIYTHTRTHIYTHSHTHICIYTDTRTHTQTHTCAHAHTQTSTVAHIHTQTLTHIHSSLLTASLTPLTALYSHLPRCYPSTFLIPQSSSSHFTLTLYFFLYYCYCVSPCTVTVSGFSYFAIETFSRVHYFMVRSDRQLQEWLKAYEGLDPPAAPEQDSFYLARPPCWK